MKRVHGTSSKLGHKSNTDAKSELDFGGAGATRSATTSTTTSQADMGHMADSPRSSKPGRMGFLRRDVGVTDTQHTTCQLANATRSHSLVYRADH